MLCLFNTVRPARTAAASSFNQGVSAVSFQRRTLRFGREAYSGPYTDEEVHGLEQFAMEVIRKHDPAKKRVDPWLRAKLGPYFKDGWQQRVAAREQLEKKKTRETLRPPESTHFVVSHASSSQVDSTEDIFAIVGLAGTQFKVTSGDVVICNKLPNAEVGKKIELMDVLMVGFKTQTLIGRPNVPGWIVTAMVEQQAKEKKQLAFYKKPKTYSQKVRGSRREVTILRIGDIVDMNAAAKQNEESKNTVDKL